MKSLPLMPARRRFISIVIQATGFRKIIGITFIAAVAAVLLGAGCQPTGNRAQPSQPHSDEKPLYEKVMLAGQEFKLELALDHEQRARGLMWRESLADDSGMLFVFPGTPPYPATMDFWMKNCLIPIDAIFISDAGFITSVHQMQPPEPGTPDTELVFYSSKAPAQFVIELRGGRAAELGLQEGARVDLRRDYLLSLAE